MFHYLNRGTEVDINCLVFMKYSYFRCRNTVQTDSYSSFCVLCKMKVKLNVLFTCLHSVTHFKLQNVQKRCLGIDKGHSALEQLIRRCGNMVRKR